MAFPLVFVIMGVFLASEPGEGISMFATAVLMAIIYWAIFPRRYCVLESKVKIALGGPFSFNIPFDTIETARSPEGLAIGINFATTFSAKKPVQIVRRGKLNVNITPGDPEPFIENLNKALNSWRNSDRRA